MKQSWAPQELIDHWMLTETETALVNKYYTDSNRLGCALLLKYFQREGKFPQRKQDIPRVIIEHVARQLHLEATVFDYYRWGKGTIDRLIPKYVFFSAFGWEPLLMRTLFRIG